MTLDRVFKAGSVLLAITVLIWPHQAGADDRPSLSIAVGAPLGASHRLGRALLPLLREIIDTDDAGGRVELWENLSPADRIVVLAEEAQLAVIPIVDRSLSDPNARDNLRALAGFIDGNQMIVRANLDQRRAYQITRLIFERADQLQYQYDAFGFLERRQSAARVSLPLHAGAWRYYRRYTRARHRSSSQPCVAPRLLSH